MITIIIIIIIISISARARSCCFIIVKTIVMLLVSLSLLVFMCIITIIIIIIIIIALQRGRGARPGAALHPELLASCTAEGGSHVASQTFVFFTCKSIQTNCHRQMEAQLWRNVRPLVWKPPLIPLW